MIICTLMFVFVNYINIRAVDAGWKRGNFVILEISTGVWLISDAVTPQFLEDDSNCSDFDIGCDITDVGQDVELVIPNVRHRIE